MDGCRDGGIGWVEPHWPYGRQLRVLTTTRSGGNSLAPFHAFNLAMHVGDDPAAVAGNRARLVELLGGLPIQWLEQVHGTDVHAATPDSVRRVPVADGAWTADRKLVLAVLTADCLPIVLADRSCTHIAVVHGGWRGLVSGVLASACRQLPVPPQIAWLGPAIGPVAYEVGEDVRTAVQSLPVAAEGALREGRLPGRWQLDLFTLATVLLEARGVTEIYSERSCTVSNDAFYSYRREGQTGRMATLVWMPGEESRWGQGIRRTRSSGRYSAEPRRSASGVRLPA